MKLKDLKPSVSSSPKRTVVYGQPGVGKSTLCSGASAPLWLDIEDGAGFINVPRVPFPDGHATTYAQVLEALDAVLEEEHHFKTLVIDALDRLESLIWDQVCQKNRKKTIEGWDFGKGYVIALSTWRDLLARLDRVRKKRDMEIVLIAHSHIKLYVNPEGDDYDRFWLRLNKKAAGLIKEWADVVAFMRFDEGASRMAGGTRAKGYNTGKRFVYTTRRAAFDAKSRIPIADKIEITGAESWEKLMQVTDTIKQSPSPF